MGEYESPKPSYESLLSPDAAGDCFGQNNWKPEKWPIWPIQNDAQTRKMTWHMGTHLRVLSESYLMNTNMTGFMWFSKIFVTQWFGLKVASALEGLIVKYKPNSYTFIKCYTRDVIVTILFLNLLYWKCFRCWLFQYDALIYPYKCCIYAIWVKITWHWLLFFTMSY